MEHYRIYKVADVNGRIIKGKDLLAPDDQQAMCEAHNDPDCPICEVWRGGTRVGSVE